MGGFSDLQRHQALTPQIKYVLKMSPVKGCWRGTYNRNNKSKRYIYKRYERKHTLQEYQRFNDGITTSLSEV